MLSSLQGIGEAVRDRIETAKAGKALLDADVAGATERFIRAKLDFADAAALDADLVQRMAAVVENYEQVASRLRAQAKLQCASPAVADCNFAELAARCEERARRYRICALLGGPPEEPCMSPAEGYAATILQVKDKTGFARAASLSPAAAEAAAIAALRA